MNWIRKHWADMLLACASVIVTIVLIDTALYFSRYKYPIFRLNYPQSYFTQNAETGYDIAQNFATSTHFFRDDAFPIWSNNLGCFDTDYNGETPYIYMAGDSLTWSFAPFNDTWGKQLQTLVGMRTLKCGVVGYGTKQELIKATRILSGFQNPKLIIVGYTAYNDPADDAHFPQTTVYNGYQVRSLAMNGLTEEEALTKYANFSKYCSFSIPSLPLVAELRCFITNHSVLFNLFKSDIRGKIDAWFPNLSGALEKQGVLATQNQDKPILDDTEVAWKKHFENILSFKKLAKEKGSNLLLVLAPYDNTKIKPFLDKENISYIDLNLTFNVYSKIKPIFWPKDGHYNITGNHLVGAVVSKYIIENDMIVVPNKKEKLEEIDAQVKKDFGIPLYRISDGL
jgi:hypothetical protein